MERVSFMKSFARSAIAASTVTLGALTALTVLAPETAFAQQVVPPPPGQRGAEAETIDAKINALINIKGGLTADQVGKRAEDTSFDVRARQAEVAAAQAEVDKAAVSYFPKLQLLAS